MVLTVLFCVFFTGRTSPTTPDRHVPNGSAPREARVCFFYRPKVTFCFAVLFTFKIQLKHKFNNKSRWVFETDKKPNGKC